MQKNNTWYSRFQVVISKRTLQTPQGSSLYMYLYHTTFDILNMQQWTNFQFNAFLA